MFDPNAGVYVSKVVNLKQPATTLKVILSAYRDSTADIRALYSLIRADSSEIERVWIVLGFDNTTLTSSGELSVVDSSANSGRPDVFVPASLENQYLEYEFTANILIVYWI